MTTWTQKICFVAVASIALSLCAKGQLKPYEECVGPTGIFGTCIPLVKCGGLFDILSEVPLRPQSLRFLQRSTCTFVKSYPWVCCSPEDDRPSTSNKSTTLPSEEPATSSDKTSLSTPQEKSSTSNPPATTTNAHPTTLINPIISPSETTFAPERITTNAGELGSKIENHPNLHLLPKTQSCGDSFGGDRIIGGIDAGLGTYPWMALIAFKDPFGGYQLACGGTLISELYILTAAHCLAKLPPGFSVSYIRLGEYDETTNPDCRSGICALPYQDIPVEIMIVHENYDSSGRHDNDIALIRMKHSTNMTNFVQPICLPIGDILKTHKLEKNQHTVVAGWGRTQFNAPAGSPVLQKVNIPVLTEKECDDIFEAHKMHKIDFQSQFCAGGETGKDSCKGDSGGPLMETIGDSQTLSLRTWQFGIVSYGPKKCGTKIPAVYTRVSFFLPWILDHLRP